MKRVLSFLLVITLLICIFPLNISSTNVVEIENFTNEEAKIKNGNELNKIHFYFDNPQHSIIDDREELSKAVKEVNCLENTMPMRSSGIFDNIQITVEFESDFFNTEAYQNFAKERENIKDSEETLEFRKKVNDYSKQYHAELLEDKADILSKFDYEKIEIVEYSPFVMMRISPEKLEEEDLLDLCVRDSVESISIDYEPVTEDTDSTWDQTLDCINAKNVITAGSYTGEGIRVGIYESGVCDTSHTNLVGKDITVRDSSANITSHATATTSIIALMAPEAEFYVSDVPSSSQGLSWFIENYCDIVNCSFGYYSNSLNADGKYTKGVREYRYIDAIYDYQIAAHFLTVCVSAGNRIDNDTSSKYNPDGEVVSPGYAYNAITVGGVDLVRFGNEIGWSHTTYACFQTLEEENVKPNISAPFSVYIPNIGINSGTSFSAPLVTGTVALLEDHIPAYKMCPERVMSVLMSTAQKTYDYTATKGEFDERVGAGIVDCGIANGNTFCSTMYNTNRTSRTQIISENVYMAAGETLDICFAWQVTSDTDNETVYLTDYDIKLIGPSNRLVDYSSLGNSNVEMIRFVATETGLHRIKVYQYSDLDPNVSGEYVALTYVRRDGE